MLINIAFFLVAFFITERPTGLPRMGQMNNVLPLIIGVTGHGDLDVASVKTRVGAKLSGTAMGQVHMIIQIILVATGIKYT